MRVEPIHGKRDPFSTEGVIALIILTSICLPLRCTVHNSFFFFWFFFLHNSASAPSLLKMSTTANSFLPILFSVNPIASLSVYFLYLFVYLSFLHVRLLKKREKNPNWVSLINSSLIFLPFVSFSFCLGNFLFGFRIFFFAKRKRKKKENRIYYYFPLLSYREEVSSCFPYFSLFWWRDI